MEKLSLDRKNLKKFGITMGFAFLIITLFILIRHRHTTLFTFIISVIFFILASVMPALLKPAYVFWMKLACILSWINTRIILFVIFYLVFTPTGLLMRLFGVDLLDRKIDKNDNTYWRNKDKTGFVPPNYERQF